MSEVPQTFGMAQPSPLEAKKAEVEAIKAKTQVAFNFDEEEDTEEKKEIFSVYGMKNDGKTAVCYGIPEPNSKIMVLSFDNKSARPRDLPFIKAANLDIKVFNVIKHLDKSTADSYQATCEVTYHYIMQMLDQAKEKYDPDWVVIDGTEVLSAIMEQVMRIRNRLAPYQGITNLNVWKERKQYIDDVHAKSVKTAKTGVIYTMYTDQHEVIDKDGQVLRKKDIPKWIGSVMQETDVTIRVDTIFEVDKRVYYAFVEGSKLPEKYPDGRFTVTGQRFRDVVSQCL